jgi:hypothetical protein
MIGYLASCCEQLSEAPVRLPARATAPMLGEARPTHYRFKLGNFEVTTIFDGSVALDGRHMPTSRKRSPRHLSDTALVLLGRAADSEDQMLLPIPKTVRAHGKALERLLRSLLNQGFVEEVPVGLAHEAWRSDGDDRYSLRITPVGLKAIGVPALASGVERPTATPGATPRPGSKQPRLIAMLMHH